MLTLGKSDLIEILNKNFRFQKTTDPDYGTAIKMDARTAFRYSMIEGSPYLTNEYGFTCKGRTNVFFHRSSLNKGFYTYCPGLFGVKRQSEKILLDKGHSPLYIKERYSKIFRGDKTIIFEEHKTANAESRAELERQVFKKIEARGDDPSKFLLSVVYDSDSYKESFFEYVACEYFNSKNYLTETQIPFKNNEGIPDFAAYRFPKLQKLIDKGFVNGGCCIPEIASASVFTNENPSTLSESNYEILIGETKTSVDNALRQIQQFSGVKLADRVFEIIPSKRTAEPGYGLFSINPDTFEIKFDEGPQQTISSEVHSNDAIFFENYIKFYVLANLPIEKIKQNFVDKNILESESSQLIQNVLNYDFDDLLDYVKGEM